MMKHFYDSITYGNRVTEFAEYTGYPESLVKELFDNSKVFFENVWGCFLPHTDYYYGSFFYAIRQMSYARKDIFAEATKDFLDKITQGDTVLDYACGVGDYLIYLGQRGIRCYGIEHKGFPVNFLKWRLKRWGVSGNVKVVDKIPEVDYSLLVSAVDHIENPLDLVREICVNTRKEVFATPCIDESYDRPTHEKHILKDVPKAFEVIRVENTRKKSL